jgi:hypothetical protein
MAVLCTIDGQYSLAIKNLKKSFSLSLLNSLLSPRKLIFGLLLLLYKTFPGITSKLVNLFQNISGIKTDKEFALVYG